MRRAAVFYILAPTSLMSTEQGRAEFSCLFVHSICCNCMLLWLKYRRKIQSQTDTQLEKEEVF